MITEIEIEDVGTLRMPNMWQEERISKVQRHNRSIAPLAFGLGMTIVQFKRLPIEKREEIHQAFLKLTSPANISVHKERE